MGERLREVPELLTRGGDLRGLPGLVRTWFSAGYLALMLVLVLVLVALIIRGVSFEWR